MTWLHPLALLLLILPAGYLLYEWRRTLRKASLVLKTVSLAAIVVALAEPTVTMPETKTGVAVLVDTSQSISDEDLSRESALVSAMARARGRNWIQVIPFAQRTRELPPGAIDGSLRLARAALNQSEGTDLETALREGLSAIPAGRIPRIVLISDGKENEGSSARAIAQLERLGIPVDTIALNRPSGIRITSAFQSQCPARVIQVTRCPLI